MKIKRFLAMCLAAIMLVSCMAVSASAAEGSAVYPPDAPVTPQSRVVETVDGGAQWSHDAGVDLGGKWVYSEVFSTLYYHSASCSLSGVPDSSGVCAPGVNAKSRVANGYIWDTAYAYYWVDV